jgi:arsenate reductase (thioredoxin)
MEKQRVLFLCTGNSCRSQMAEAFLRKYAGQYFEAYSAGLEPKPINPYTIQVMDEIGTDISAQTSKNVDVYLGKVLFKYLITVCDDAEKNCPVIWVGVNTRIHWSFEDPAKFEGSAEEKLAKFREVRDQIQARIGTWLAEQNIPLQTNNTFANYGERKGMYFYTPVFSLATSPLRAVSTVRNGIDIITMGIGPVTGRFI